MSNYTVKINFSVAGSGNPDYDLPLVFQVEDPEPRNKDVIIEGTRGDGSIRIKGGKKSHTITVRGNLFDTDGYKDLTEKINEMRTNITTDIATLTMKHLEGVNWIIDWSYTVVRNEEITFEKSFRTGKQPYSVSFLVLAY